MFLLLLSVAVNFVVGLHLGQGRRVKNYKKTRAYKRKRKLFWIAVAGNIGVLILFKIGNPGDGLPLGISFYTFQILSYLMDVYRGECTREESLVDFASYILMFPQLISGPIVRYDEVRKELKERPFRASNIQDGLGMFILGLSYKVLLADRIGILWHEVQVTGFESISVPLAWMAAVAYSLQIYFDFHGYSLMAMGLGKMLGFDLPENFRTPYMARSVRDFYRRWHITLGRWFCRYVYIPLGGSRKGEWKTIQNLAVVWLLTAIWHGNSVNYLLWGGLLLLCIIVERQLERLDFVKNLKILPHLYLWFIIPITWMCFANTDLTQLQIYLERMFGVGSMLHGRTGDWMKAWNTYGHLFLISFLCCTDLVRKLYVKWKDSWLVRGILAVLLWVCIHRVLIAGNNPFLYFQF